jgi:hypothetical protein
LERPVRCRRGLRVADYRAGRGPYRVVPSSPARRRSSAPRAKPCTRRAKIINAEGERQAAQELLEAAQVLAPVPQAMQLRYLATLFDIAGERSSTIVFPFPIDLMQAWPARAKTARSAVP